MFQRTMKLGEHELTIESGRMAKQANGSAIVRYKDSMILVTACGNKEPLEGMDFFPLQVEYREKMYASGKIPGGFIKRENRPSDDEILSARVIDRPIRPLFPEGFKNEVQVICNVLSSDGELLMDTFGIIAASMALNLSDIPFLEPVAGVRVGRLNGEFLLNPTKKEMKDCDIELVISGGKGFISMVEGESKEVSEEEMLAAIEFGQKYIDEICNFQQEIVKEFGKEKFEFTIPEIDEELKTKVLELGEATLEEISQTKIKKERNDKRKALYDEIWEKLEEEHPEEQKDIFTVLHDREKDIMRSRIVKEKIRIDGRKPDEIRQITCELDILPRAHGSALFTRGETQSLGVCTLGSEMDTQLVENIYGTHDKHFYLHYNFPPYSVGEIKKIFGVSRREVGHGHLAERSFYAVLPSAEAFPYTIRVVSEILESNGSSSMASVCSNSLSLMAAGVPLKKPVSGIAMGLVKEGDDTVILSDILGDEDHLGDMDFKVTGTADGICAYQMDIKIHGITMDIMRAALEQAKQGRLHILGKMNEAIPEPRQELSEHAPRIISMKIQEDEIKTLIGSGGKTIQEITKRYDVKIDISDEGLVKIMSTGPNGDECKAYIEKMFEKPEINKVYDATVKSIQPYGAFVEFLPKCEGLLHISEIALERIEKVEDYLKLGDVVKVQFAGKDDRGKFKLKRKNLLREEQKKAEDKEEPKE